MQQQQTVSCLVHAWIGLCVLAATDCSWQLRCLLNLLTYVNKHVYVGMFHVEFSVQITVISLSPQRHLYSISVCMIRNQFNYLTDVRCLRTRGAWVYCASPAVFVTYLAGLYDNFEIYYFYV